MCNFIAYTINTFNNKAYTSVKLDISVYFIMFFKG